MKNKSFLLFLFAISGLTSGCSDMIRSLQAESADADGPPRQKQAQREEPVYKARTLRGLSANNVGSFEPPVKREYGGRAPASSPELAGGYDGGGSAPMPSGQSNTRRMTRADFVDSNANENSLWDAQGQNNYLFANNRRHELGDIISVDVQRELKREIQYALWMNLPPEQRRSKKRNPASAAVDKDGKKIDPAADPAKPAAATAAADTKSEAEKGKDAAEEAAKTNMEPSSPEDDVVRMEVVESSQGGMIRLLGQKRVIYRGVSRVVEIVALANSRDVDEKGAVKSTAFVDTKTQVVQ